tara:strand:+ start:30 stop:536 length:507 start_codon:yes stop_codon:yes gene_type:complete
MSDDTKDKFTVIEGGRKKGSKKKSLTPKQIKFAEALGHGIDGEPCSISDAYRYAYDTKNMSDAVIRNEASKLSQHHDVTIMVDKIIADRNKKKFVKEVSTKERIENELWKIVDEEDNNTHRLRALEMMGKSIAMFSEVTINKEDQRSLEDIEKELRDRLDSISDQSKS